jgi:hypothetical protein
MRRFDGGFPLTRRERDSISRLVLLNASAAHTELN